MRVAFADVIVAVTAFLATYYFLTGEQQGSSLAANRSEFTQNRHARKNPTDLKPPIDLKLSKKALSKK